MKRKWGKAIIEVQRFEPQFCVQVCDSNENHSGNDREIYHLIRITDISPANALRVDNSGGAADGLFQYAEVWNVGSTPPSGNYSKYQLESLIVRDPTYVKISGSETPNKTKYDGTTGTSYNKYNETIYSVRSGYAFKAEKISS